MPLLQALRQSKFIARSVLVWFVLACGLAVAAPIVNPQMSALVCTASGAVKLVSGTGDSAPSAASHTLDCVLCLAFNAPPPPAAGLVAKATLLSYALQAAPAAGFAKRIAAPYAARGPPAA